MRCVLVVVFVLVATAADAARVQNPIRVPIWTGPTRTNAEIICPWVSASVAWDWPAPQQAMMLGQCPPPRSPR